jgi:hypothetical protein
MIERPLSYKVRREAFKACNAELSALLHEAADKLYSQEKSAYEAIGWMYAYACHKADCSQDIRLIEVPKIIEEFQNAFSGGKE